MRHRQSLFARCRRARGRGCHHKSCRRSHRCKFEPPHTTGLDIRLSGNDAGTSRAHRECPSSHEPRLLSHRGNRLIAPLLEAGPYQTTSPSAFMRCRATPTRSCRRGRARGANCRPRAFIPGIWSRTRAQAHPGNPEACRTRAAAHLRACVWLVSSENCADGAAGVAAART